MNLSESTPPPLVPVKFRCLCLALLIGAANCPAATVANWKVMAFQTGTASSTSGLNTDSPVFGDGTAGDMDGVGVAGLFGTTSSPQSVTLSVSQTLTVSATVTLTGGLSTNAGAGYRFSVQNEGGQFAGAVADSWGGGWNHILTTGNSTGDGFYRARTDGNFMSNSGDAEQLANSPTSSGTFSGDSTATYLWTMTITRASATTVDLSSSFVGGDGSFSESYNLTGVTTSLFAYNAIGIQSTAASDLDQLSLSNVQYSVIPEPSMMLLGSLGVLLFLRRRRHSA